MNKRIIEKEYDIFKYLEIEWDNEGDIQAILEFVIFWNKIEKNEYKKLKKWDRLKQYKVLDGYFDEKIKEDNKEINNILNHFTERYIKKEKFSFSSLENQEGSPIEKEKHCICEKYLHSKNLDFTEKKELVSYIIYRFRNKLFHWHKYVHKDQNENFIMINNFLYSIELLNFTNWDKLK